MHIPNLDILITIPHSCSCLRINVILRKVRSGQTRPMVEYNEVFTVMRNIRPVYRNDTLHDTDDKHRAPSLFTENYHILAQGLQPDTFINLSVPPVVNDINSSSTKLGIILFKRCVFL